MIRMEDPRLCGLTSLLSEKDLNMVIDRSLKVEEVNDGSIPEDKKKNLDKIQDMIVEFQSSKNKSKSDALYIFNSLRELSVNGGFFCNKYRRTFYDFILNLNDKRIETLKLVDFDIKANLATTTTEVIQPVFIESEYSNTIKVDAYRSKTNTLFEPNEYYDTNTLIKQNIFDSVSKLTTLLDKRYHYFQGYHDMTLLFIILFKDEHKAIQSVQKFSEFYLKEGLNSKETQNKFNFYHEMKLISRVVEKYSEETSKEINDYFSEGFFFVTSWLITFFTHNMSDIHKQYRIIDYIITSAPNTIYYLSATIITEEFVKLRSKYPDTDIPMDKIYRLFQDLDYDNFDFNSSIVECEKFKAKLHLEQFKSRTMLEAIEDNDLHK